LAQVRLRFLSLALSQPRGCWPSSEASMTVNLSPEAFKKTEKLMTLNSSSGTVNLCFQDVKKTEAKVPSSLHRDSNQGKVRLTVESSGVFPDGVTRYQIHVEADGSEWIVQRRFSDFEALEEQVAPSGIRRAPLPAKDFLGLQNKYNFRDFNRKRHTGLQAYLSSLANHLGSLSEMPAMQAFCNPAVQGVAPAACGGTAKAAAGAAAVGAVAGLMVPVVGGVVVAAAGAGAAAYATQRSDNVGEISRKVGAVTANAIGTVGEAVKKVAVESAAKK